MGLFIIGTVISWIAMAIGVSWDADDDRKTAGKAVVCYVVFFVGLVMATQGAAYKAHRDALDGKNPYHKEYVYRDMPDGTKVLTDSVYVRE